MKKNAGIKKCAQCQTPILSFIESKVLLQNPTGAKIFMHQRWQGCENRRIEKSWIRHDHECIDLTFSYFYLFLTATVPK